MNRFQAKQKEEPEEAKRRKKAQPIYGQLKQVAEPENHRRVRALLSNCTKAIDNDQEAEQIIRLQQTYGNRYVQRFADGNREINLDEDTVKRIEAQRDSGRPLEPGVRTDMEAAFESDFSQVKIHTNPEADMLSKELHAKAFTSGKHIFFSETAYEPGSQSGRQLLAHELTHVLQQEPGKQKAATCIGHSLEAEAAAAERSIVIQEAVSINRTANVPSVQLKEPETEESKVKKEEESFDMGSPVSNAKETFYKINKKLLADVHKDFKFTYEGKKCAAETRWEIETGSPTPIKKDKEWVIDPIPWKIKEIIVELPRWTNYSKASSPDKEEWARFIKCTRVHEQGHVDKAREYVSKEIPTEWKSARGADKAELKKKLQELLDKILDKLEQERKKYDEQTTQGETQGAHLKPPPAK